MNSRCSKSGESGDGPEFGKVYFNQVSDEGSLQRLVLALEAQTRSKPNGVSLLIHTYRTVYCIILGAGQGPDDCVSSGLRALHRCQQY